MKWHRVLFPPCLCALKHSVAVIVLFFTWLCFIGERLGPHDKDSGPMSELVWRPCGLDTGKSPHEETAPAQALKAVKAVQEDSNKSQQLNQRNANLL